MTRQNYYKKRQAKKRREVDEGLVVDLVKRERQLQPRIGCRKLHRMLSDELAEAGIEIGRDRLFEVMRDNDLLVPPLPRSPRTTHSRHSLPVYGNLISDLEVTGPDQVWVTDITYIRTLEGFEYLTLIMDRWSHKIVGHHCSEELTARASIRALESAIADLPDHAFPTHHSDRGCQFCSHQYVERLQSRGLAISMTEVNHCAENSHAERLNGILKQEYALGTEFLTREHARRAAEEAVWLYNNRRPHTALEFHVPAAVHARAA
jgi:transposase InsO family protein